MQTDITNKKITGNEKRLVNKQTQAYHFPGQGVYKPLSVQASSSKEALEKYEASREKVTKSQVNSHSQKEVN